MGRGHTVAGPPAFVGESGKRKEVLVGVARHEGVEGCRVVGLPEARSRDLLRRGAPLRQGAPHIGQRLSHQIRAASGGAAVESTRAAYDRLTEARTST
jgi:hypothetical protein